MSESGGGRRHRIRMLIPLWGAQYYERWLSLVAPALLAPGNLLHLNERAELELVFLCKSRDLDFLQCNATIRLLGEQVRLKTITIDEFFPPHTAVSYGVPLTLAYAKGIQDLGDAGLGTFVMLLNADFVLSEGSLAQVLRRLDDGYHIVTAPSLRVVENEVRPILEERLEKHSGPGCFSARAMMAIAERHLHQTVRARIINRDRPIGAWYYHLLYWRISTTCLAGRSFLLMPLCFQIRRQAQTVVCPVDYGFIQEYCPGGRYAAIGDSDELLMVELQARDSEAELLEVLPRFASAAEAMDYRVTTIVTNAAKWSTAEHRRAFSHPLLFHSDDLPPDTTEQLAEFDRQIGRIIERMPPPASAIRHYHWLSALGVYTAQLRGDGVPFLPRLLCDQANRIFFTLSQMEPELAARLPHVWPMLSSEQELPRCLAETIREASVTLTLNGLVHEVWRINPHIRIFAAEVAEMHGRDATIELPAGSVAPGESVLVYLLTDSLPHWPNFKEFCDSVLAEGGQVTIVFRDRLWTAFEAQLQANAWMLSQLEKFFGDYVASIEPIPAMFSFAADAWQSVVTRTLAYGYIVRLDGRARDPNPHLALRPQDIPDDA